MIARYLTIAAAAWALLAAGPALAGPQILAVVASGSPLPMACGSQVCRVDLTTFCLQELAGVPEQGTADAWAPASLPSVALTATDGEGRSVRLAADQVALVSARGNRAVSATVDRAALAAQGLQEPRLTIGEHVSIVPQAMIEDDDPAVAAEIALVTGPMRRLAHRLVDGDEDRIAATQVLALLVNAIPDDAVGDVADRAALWDAHIGPGLPGTALARPRFERCSALPGGGFVSFRQCLAAHHDMLLGPLNRAYWQASAAGG